MYDFPTQWGKNHSNYIKFKISAIKRDQKEGGERHFLQPMLDSFKSPRICRVLLQYNEAEISKGYEKALHKLR